MPEKEKKDLVALLRNYDQCNDSDIDEAVNELENAYSMISQLNTLCAEHRGKIDQLQSDLTQIKEMLGSLARATLQHIEHNRFVDSYEKWEGLEQQAQKAFDHSLQGRPERWGCNCDLDPEQQPDACVLDASSSDDCDIAKSIKRKEECDHWVRY